jgi:PleD family two-component response regulator
LSCKEAGWRPRARAQGTAAYLPCGSHAWRGRSKAASEKSEPRPPAEGRLRILIVEDNDDAREMLRTLLDLAGHEMHEAADGLEGLRLATELKAQVALVDSACLASTASS